MLNASKLPLGVEQEFLLMRTNGLLGNYPDFAPHQHLVDTKLEKETSPIMVEVGDGIDDTPQSVATNLRRRRNDLLIVSQRSEQVAVATGLHPTLNLPDAPRYEEVSARYGHLITQYGDYWRLTTCSMHVHVGLNEIIKHNCAALLEIFREPMKRLQQLHRQYRDKISSIIESLRQKNEDIPFVLNGGNDDLLTFILQDWLVRETNKFAWVFAALSSNSPFLEGRDRGNINERLQVLQRLPLYGLMSFGNVEEHFITTIEMMFLGDIINAKEYWFSIRSHPFLPTVENRICDIPLVDEDAVAITALVQALTSWLLRGLLTRGPACFAGQLPLLSTRNMTEMSLRGLHGTIHDALAPAEQRVPVQVAIKRLIERVRPEAELRGSSSYLDHILHEICGRGSGSYLQRGWAEQAGGSLEEVSQNLFKAAHARLREEPLDWSPAEECLHNHLHN
jgi:gamma-glutamyl:cysteine ligase YbdK (ATP-grasp superfamily)